MNDVTINESKLTRVEVIDERGRRYSHYDDGFDIELFVQDNERTLKIFITRKKYVLKT